MKKNSSKSGLFFVLSAPSGTGKTTIARKLLEEIPTCHESVSVTTRKPRVGEREGVDYFFVDEQEFRRMVNDGELFEWEEVHGRFYGTPWRELKEAVRDGRDLLFDIDTRGALSIKKGFPNSCLIFLLPPSIEVLEQRLRARRTEPEASLKRRLEAAKREREERDKFDYVIINDDLNRAFQEIRSVVEERRSGRKEP